MAGEGYGSANAIFDASRTNGGVGLTAGHASNPNFGIIHIGTGATAGNIASSVAAVYGDLVISEVIVALGVIPTTVAPIFKLWRRPDATNVAAPGSGTNDTAMTPATMTIPLTAPTPVRGNVYVLRLTDGNILEPGEAFILEIDTADSGAAATAVVGVNAYYYRFSFDAKQSSPGAAKVNTNAIGRAYVVTS